MTCKPCVENLTKRLLARGLNEKEARRRAKKAIKSHERRQKAGRKTFLFNLRRWLFKTAWRATIHWRRWIGKGFNPDYTLPCVQGTCAPDMRGCENEGNNCNDDNDCPGNCYQSAIGSCGCPAPLPFSEQVRGCTAYCLWVGGICKNCFQPFGFCAATCSVTDCTTGTCGYNCIPPRVWNGEECVLPVVKKRMGYSNGLVSVSVG